MRKFRIQLLNAFFCASLAFSTSGCVALIAGAAVGAGGVMFVKGSMEKNFDYPVSKVYKAALGACKSLSIPVQEKKLDKHNATVKGMLTDGKNVTIEVEALTEKASKLKVRVGVFGDEQQSLLIVNAVQKRLRQ